MNETLITEYLAEIANSLERIANSLEKIENGQAVINVDTGR